MVDSSSVSLKLNFLRQGFPLNLEFANWARLVGGASLLVRFFLWFRRHCQMSNKKV